MSLFSASCTLRIVSWTTSRRTTLTPRHLESSRILRCLYLVARCSIAALHLAYACVERSHRQTCKKVFLHRESILLIQARRSHEQFEVSVGRTCRCSDTNSLQHVVSCCVETVGSDPLSRRIGAQRGRAHRGGCPSRSTPPIGCSRMLRGFPVSPILTFNRSRRRFVAGRAGRGGDLHL